MANAEKVVDCLRVRLLRVNGFADIVTRLAVLRTDRRTEDILEIVKEILALLSELLNKDVSAAIFRSLHQLPQPPADFTGREDLIDKLLEDFKKAKGATISGLTGMGGIGKTALGLKVAHKIAANYPDAQIFLDLKGTTEPLTALDIARHVILTFEPTADLRALDENNMQAAYQSVLHGKKVLLFFDNARSADQVALLRPSETCAMLVTSRWTFSVPGLETRRVHVMEEGEAKVFLMELCKRIGEKAVDLAKACAYLPLALRIAGSFLGVNSEWSIEKYLTQLSDRKQRLATLQESRAEAELTAEPDLLATFDLSYSQLSEENQKRWRALGVFPASFAWSAASAMWELEENETAKTLGLFRRYSLLEFDETSGCYSLHDLLTDYALSQMGDGEEWEVRLKHASHYMNVMQETDRLYKSGNEYILVGLRLFDLEWDNIRSGQAWVAENYKRNSQTAELCMNYPRAYYVLNLRLHSRQNNSWLQNAIIAAETLGNKTVAAELSGVMGINLKDLGEVRKAIEIFNVTLSIYVELKDKKNQGVWLGNLGIAYAALGETRKAIEFYEQQLIIVREIGDRRGEGNALGNLGNALYGTGEQEKGIELVKQALEIFEVIESPNAEWARNKLKEWGVGQ